MPHWIYVLGRSDLRGQAELWAGAKSTSGKSYSVIKARVDETPSGKLKGVGNDDVLYVYSHMWVDGDVPLGKVGETKLTAAALANLLKNEGLDKGHKALKIFCCRGADNIKGDAESFGKKLADAMRGSAMGYSEITVYAYRGETNPAGFDGHKTAGLDTHEVLATIERAEWDRRKLRAKDQRDEY